MSKKKTANDYFDEGNEKWAQKKYEEALLAYGKALKLCPKDPTFLNNRGNILAELKRVAPSCPVIIKPNDSKTKAGN